MYVGHLRQAKIQIRLRIRTVWSESSFGVVWIAKDAKFLHADNKDADYTELCLPLALASKGTFCHIVANFVMII